MEPAPPVFTAMPYIQPGPEGKLRPGAETVRLAWQTGATDADFAVTFGRTGRFDGKGGISRSIRSYKGKREIDGTYNYVCTLSGLELGTEYNYRVTCGPNPVAEGYFTTRQPRGRMIRFAAFGDNSFGEPGERAVAFHTYRAHPDFIMNVGDNVYESGLDNEYTRHFFPVYNADAASPDIGAPLLRSIPFYSVIANHDVAARDPHTRHPCADFDANPDSLGYYTNFYFPLNGPQHPAFQTPTRGGGARADFMACAGDRFPQMANYSYDYGDAHFICIDSNIYVDPTDPALAKWIEADLSATDARWKFAVFHHPPFNVGAQHYHEQHMRALCPLFERLGVDFVLGGHEHNYQRTVPLTFVPDDLSGAKTRNTTSRLTPGKITLDTEFDGVTRTKPKGVIYVVTGAGGKHLYDEDYTGNPKRWLLAEDKLTPYAANMVSDRHSLTLFDLDRDSVVMRQIDQFGAEVDRITVTKV